MNSKWKWFLPGYPANLLASIIYILVCLIAYRAHTWRFRNGVLTCIGGTFVRDHLTVTRIWGRPGAQTIGTVQCYASEDEYKRVELHVHENTHIVEAFICALGAVAVVPVIFAGIGWSAPLGLALAMPIGAILYTIIYVVIFTAYYLTEQEDEEPGWEDDYHRNILEIWAYAAAARFQKMTAEERKSVWS